MYRNGGVKEVKGEYEDDHALFMLHSLFNQFPRQQIEKSFKDANKHFYTALKALEAEQNRTKTKPRVAVLPTAVTVGRRDQMPPVKKQKHDFYALDDNFDFASVVKWKVFDMQNDEHLRILKGTSDPISLDDLLEIGISNQDQIVQLPCATKKMRCNFTKTSIVECLRAKPECPVCKTYYPIPGKMPSGTMAIAVDQNLHCDSYQGDGSIVINFIFPDGIQGKNHEKPGQRYTGTNRVAYLPHVEEGKKALLLLIEAFKRGELFNIGKSLGTGAENQITYGSIHLKTATRGGKDAHGWPDNSYFNRLRDECAGKMIFEEEVEKEINQVRNAAAQKII